MNGAQVNGAEHAAKRQKLAPLEFSPLTAVSAVDGRYAGKTVPLREYMSEYALHKFRCQVMVEWVLHMSREKQMPEAKELSAASVKAMRAISQNFDVKAAAAVK